MRDDEFGENEFSPWDILETTSVGSQPYGSRAQGKILDGNLVWSLHEMEIEGKGVDKIAKRQWAEWEKQYIEVTKHQLV